MRKTLRHDPLAPQVQVEQPEKEIDEAVEHKKPREEKVPEPLCVPKT
jgi:hypothetical protein